MALHQAVFGRAGHIHTNHTCFWEWPAASWPLGPAPLASFLREDLRGKMVDLTECATGSYSWVTQPVIQLKEAAASLTAKIMDIQCSEECLKS